MSEYPSFAAYPVPAAEDRPPLRQLRGIGFVAILFIGITAILDAVLTVKCWNLYDLAVAYVQGEDVTEDDGIAAIQTLSVVLVITAVVLIVTGVVFLVWLWRARINAEILGGPDTQRRSRGWTIGAWFCPVVNFWYPYQILADIRRVSAGRRPASGMIVGWWWGLMVVSEVIGEIMIQISRSSGDPLGTIHTIAIAMTIGTGLQAAAAGLVIRMIMQIDEWQFSDPF